MNEYAESSSDRELVRLAITGQGNSWERLQSKVFTLIDTIANRIEQARPKSESNAVSTSSEVAKDILKIATDWAKAKVERPSLENSKLRAEIASEFAEAKRRLAEARKSDAEAAKAELELESMALNQDIEHLERLLRLVSLVGQIQFGRVGSDGHLLLSSNEPIPEPCGDRVDV